MKKVTTSLTAILLIVCSAFTQEGLTFKMQYKPQTKYSQSVQQNMVMEINYSGSKETMDALEKSGTKNPAVTKIESSYESVMKTGKKNDSALFPVSMEFTKAPGGNGTPTIVDGTIFYGHCSVDKAPVYDSVYSPDGKDEEVKKIADLVSKAVSQIHLPDKKMKPGDEFRQEDPISIPLGAVKFDMAVVTIYKLISIKDNIGFFDVSINYVANVITEGVSAPMTGSGKGKLEFDAANTFFRAYELNIDIETNMNVQGMDMKIKTNTAMLLHSTIESIKE